MRDQAITTLVEMYRHIGERVRDDVAKKDISSAKYNVFLAVIFITSCKFDCIAFSAYILH